MNDTILLDKVIIPTLFKRHRVYCNPLRPSVCPSRYLLLNHWTKSNQIWCVSCSHEWGMQRHFFFCPAPWGPGKGPKGQISLNINKFQFQRFLNQTLCAFSQMKDIKHIRRVFHLAAWVMAQGWDLGVPLGVGWSKKKIPKFNQICCVSYLHVWHMQRHPFLGPRPLGPWGGAKRSNIIDGSKNFNFLNMVMSHTYQNKGMSSRPGYTESV